MRTVAGLSLGCKENTYETSAVLHSFEERGYAVVGPKDEADVYVLNTCAVTSTGEQKCRQLLHSLRRSHPQAVICVMGCYSQLDRSPSETFRDANVVVGVGQRTALPELVERYLREGEQIVSVSDNKKIAYEPMSVASIPGHDRGIIKLGEGCDRYCSYCIIPYARGNPRSRPLEQIREEAKALAAAGYKEVVLSATNLSLYGKDLDTPLTLADAVLAIAETEGISRIRIGSIDPLCLRELIRRGVLAEPKVCPHFHLSVQSGCDTVLARMNRRYTADDCLASMEQARAIRPRVAFSADLICGFPGETEEEFAQTLAFVARGGFMKVHAFPYSPRPGTRAAELEGQLTEQVKHARVRTLSSAADGTEAAYLSSLVGQEIQVLVESKTRTVEGRRYAFGFAAEYAKVLLPVRFVARAGEILTFAAVSVRDGHLLIQ